MSAWNAVVSVHEHGWKQAFAGLSRFGLLSKTPFLNVLLFKADDLQGFLDTLAREIKDDPASWTFLSRLIPVTRTFSFQSPEAFEAQAKEALQGWLPALAGRSFYLRVRRRGFKGKLSGHGEERLLDTFLLAALAEAGKPGRLTFADPDAVIAVETIGSWAGLSLFTRDDLDRYPFIRID